MGGRFVFVARQRCRTCARYLPCVAARGLGSAAGLYRGDCQPDSRSTRYDQNAWLVGRIEGQEAAKGKVLPFSDLLIAVAAIEQGYGVLTRNLRHFQRVPGLTVVPI